MIIEQKENYTFISYEGKDINEFLKDFEVSYSDLKATNLIIQLSETINISNDNFFVILKHAERHIENGMSFVVIKKNVDIDIFPEWFTIVPTFTEAKDVLEMEEIQRELGL